jgi:hypothetical protein
MSFQVAGCPGKRSERHEVEGLLYSFNDISDYVPELKSLHYLQEADIAQFLSDTGGVFDFPFLG